MKLFYSLLVYLNILLSWLNQYFYYFQTNGAKRGEKGKKSLKESTDDDDQDNDSDKPRKRGRPRTVQDIKGFTNTEVRRFLKSMKKFGRPLERFVPIHYNFLFTIVWRS